MASKGDDFLGGSIFDLDNDGSLNFVEQAYAVTFFEQMASANAAAPLAGCDDDYDNAGYIGAGFSVEQDGCDTEEEYRNEATGEEPHMKAKNEQKQKVLQNSFDILKDDFAANASELQNAIGQVMAINPQLAINMWHEMVEINQSLFTLDMSSYGAAYELTGEMLCELHNKEAFVAMEPLLVADSFLIEAVFGKTPTINYSHHRVIGSLIKSNQLQAADRMLGLLYNNKRALKDFSFTKVLQELIEEELLAEREYGSCFISTHDTVEYSSEVLSLIHGWIEKVTDEKERAKLDISYIKIC